MVCVLRSRCPVQAQKLENRSKLQEERPRIPHPRGQFHRSAKQSVDHIKWLLIKVSAKGSDLRRKHLLPSPIGRRPQPGRLPYQECHSICRAAIVCTAIAWNIPIHIMPSTHPSPHSTASGSTLARSPPRWLRATRLIAATPSVSSPRTRFEATITLPRRQRAAKGSCRR